MGHRVMHAVAGGQRRVIAGGRVRIPGAGSSPAMGGRLRITRASMVTANSRSRQAIVPGQSWCQRRRCTARWSGREHASATIHFTHELTKR